jgi:hypothetical protein
MIAAARRTLARIKTEFTWRRPANPAENYDRYARWPVVVLAAGAFVAIWGGWVDLGRMAGFGPVNLLPGITPFYVDLSVTLPLGMEVYSAYALGVWLTHKTIRPEARLFAGWSVLASLIIGAGGQVTYHLLSANGVTRAPSEVVVLVACVPVAVMGMGAALAHLLTVNRRPAAVAPEPEDADHTDARPRHADRISVQSVDAAGRQEQAGPTLTWTTKEERTELICALRDAGPRANGKPLSYERIAALVGTSKPTVTRTLQRRDREPSPASREWAESVIA